MNYRPSNPFTITVAAFVIGLLLSITTSAQLRGWGANFNGNLGNGNTTDQPSPIIIPLPDAVGITSSYEHNLYLKADGTIRAAGKNFYGQLGNNSTTNSSSFVTVSGLTNVIQVAGSVDNSVALRSDGTVWSWGRNDDGGNGNGSTSGNQLVPAQIASLSDVIQISSGYYHRGFALKSNGTVWAWGHNVNGPLGDGTTTSRTTPVQVGTSVAGFNNIIAISAGENHCMALKADGTVWIWGDNNYGQIGNGSTTPANQIVPVKNTTLTNVTQISAGAGHSMVLKADGTVWIWGLNGAAEVGNGSTAPTNQLVPVQNTTVTNIVEIDAGKGNSSYVRRRDGTIWAWGYNFNGQLGDGTTATPRTTPYQIPIGTGNAVLNTSYYNGFVLNPVIPVATGSNVITQGKNVKLFFNQITAAGNVSYTAVDPTTTGLTVPSGYTIQANQPAYSVTSTAATSGEIRVCIAVNEFNAANYPYLKILHEEGGALVDRTFGYTTSTRNVCARVTSFSRFVVATSLAPTAANVTISGRVLNSDGRAISRAQVRFNDMNGNLRTAVTNQFGYFTFDEVEAGQTYVFQATAKGYNFAPQVITPNDNVSELNFVAQ